MRSADKNWLIIVGIWIGIALSVIAVTLFLSQNSKTGLISVEEMLEGLQQNDTRLLNYILKYSILLPVAPVQHFASASSFKNKSTKNSSRKKFITSKSNRSHKHEIQDLVKSEVIKLLQQKLASKTKGFFVEYRAYDGEMFSKTLHLEQEHNWTGLLIEPDPSLFNILVSKARKSWLSNACLSPDPFPQKLEFMSKSLRTSYPSNSLPVKSQRQIANTSGKPLVEVKNLHGKNISKQLKSTKNPQWKKVRITCFPLFSLLSALDTKLVDYFNLDAQGLELQILHNIPWDSIIIHVVSVKTHLIPEGFKELNSFMESKNYKLAAQIHEDYIFADQITILATNY